MATVSFTSAGDTLYAYLAGEIDHDAAQQLRVSIDTTVSCRMPQQLVLDFSGVGFMDSSGIGVILGRYRVLRERGGSLGVIHMNDHVSRIFHMSGMDRVIHQLDKVQEARR